MKPPILIPRRLRIYPEGSVKTTIRKSRALSYMAGRGELIDVILWHRWPSYDFIFGVPAHGNRHRVREAAFFQYRDVRRRRVVCGFYVDRRELKILLLGFKKLWERSRAKCRF